MPARSLQLRSRVQERVGAGRGIRKRTMSTSTDSKARDVVLDAELNDCDDGALMGRGRIATLCHRIKLDMPALYRSLTRSGVNLRARYLASMPLTAELRETPFQKLQRNLNTPTWLSLVRIAKIV